MHCRDAPAPFVSLSSFCSTSILFAVCSTAQQNVQENKSLSSSSVDDLAEMISIHRDICDPKHSLLFSMSQSWMELCCCCRENSYRH